MARSRSDKSFYRARDLTTQLLENGLNDTEACELAELLRRDRELQEWYVDHVVLHGMLELAHLEPLKAQEPFTTSPAENIFPNVNMSASDECNNIPGTTQHSNTFGFLGNLLQQGLSFLGKPSVFGLILALGLPGIVLLVLLIDISHQPIAPAPTATARATIARVTQQHECVWDKAATALSVGTPLCSGQKLQIDSGFIELTFADGTTVLLEGPSTFQAIDRAGGYLHVGHLVAKMAEGAQGFAVQTPTATIVDLGTEFGVEVSDNGTAEAHVFQGEIEVITRPTVHNISPLKKQLHAGQAVKVSTDKTPQIVAMPASRLKFAQHIPGTLPKPTIIFAHHGANDPMTEGWRRLGFQTGSHDKEGNKAGPIFSKGEAAWFMHSQVQKDGFFYAFDKGKELTHELMEEAKQKGWTMRSRVWIDPQSPAPENPKDCLFLFGYRDDKLTWGLNVLLNESGDHQFEICRDGSPDDMVTVVIPNSRDRYVDYELRKRPGTNGVEVLANGRLVARRHWKPEPDELPRIRFGLKRAASNIRCSRVEWGIFRETSTPNPGQANPVGD